MTLQTKERTEVVARQHCPSVARMTTDEFRTAWRKWSYEWASSPWVHAVETTAKIFETWNKTKLAP